MFRASNILLSVVLAGGIYISVGLAVGADEPASKSDVKAVEKVKPADVATPAKNASAKTKRELTPAQVELRDLVRQTLAAHQNASFNTRDNSATEIMNYCLAFGCATEVVLMGPDQQRINGITCLCYNYPCAGYEMLGMSEKHIAARIGYGYQEHPGELLAMLAVARVSADYPVRVGKNVRTVADLVEAEKLACRSGADLSLLLIALSNYVDEPEWKNDLGETWSIERMLKEEMTQPVVTAPEGGLNRLMGFSYAVARRGKSGKLIDGQFQRAQTYVSDFHDFALQLQNADGSWGPYFLAARSAGPDEASQLRSTGRVLEWLTMSLADAKLEDARVTGAVDRVARLLGEQRRAQTLSTREIASLGHALHALATYDERVFKPADAPAAEKPAATASR